MATTYTGVDGQPVSVPVDTVRAVLTAMGRPADDDAAATAQLARLEHERLSRLVEPCAVLRRGQRPEWAVALQAPQNAPVRARLELEDGSERRVAVDHALGRLRLPPDLPVGEHRLIVGAGEAEEMCTLLVTPERCALPSDLGRAWGWMLQLYALRSEASWGIGDLGDLSGLARWSGSDLGAAFVLCNPLGAAAPVLPQEASPYYPSSRRYLNPLYLRIEDVPELGTLDPADREHIARVAAQARAGNRVDRIDRDAAYERKLATLELIFDRGHIRGELLAAFREREGEALERFALFNALAERHGVPYQRWPSELVHPGGSSVARARSELAPRVTFHAWVQLLCDEQLGAAQAAARTAGMPVGLIADVPVGVGQGGADAWALQDDLATDVTVGAPPDAFNQRGQDWQQPPLLPQRLRSSAYRPFRDLMRSCLRHAGGVRIDHVMGLFRLFWIPAGASPAEGTYVRYPASDLLGVLALESQRAGALVVGEDLGTVEPGVREALREVGVLGSAVLYFERGEDGQALPADRYRQDTLASVTTHDLPTAAGWWSGEDVRLRVELDLLGGGTSAEREWQQKDAERTSMTRLLTEAGLLGDGDDLRARIEAMYRFLGSTPALLVAAALGDAVGDLRQPNLPGTIDQYPNWRLPLAEQLGGGHRPLLLEDLHAHPGVLRLAALLRSARSGQSS